MEGPKPCLRGTKLRCHETGECCTPVAYFTHGLAPPPPLTSPLTFTKLVEVRRTVVLFLYGLSEEVSLLLCWKLSTEALWLSTEAL